MRRDLDLIRDILLRIESGKEYDGAREFYYSKPEDMGLTGCTAEEFHYHCTLLIEDGFIDGAATVVNTVVRRLTSRGHDFLDDIRDPRVWDLVKIRLGGIPGVALGVIGDLARSEIKRQLALP